MEEDIIFEDCSPQDNTIKQKIYFEELSRRKIILNKEITDNVVEECIIPILNFNKEDDIAGDGIRPEITLYLNSQGGELDSAFALISVIENSKTPIIIHALGRCWSAAFLVLIAGHKRICSKYSSVMIHQIHGNPPQIPNVSNMLNVSRYFMNEWKKIKRYIYETTNIPKSLIDKIFKQNLDYYFTLDELLKFKIIDEVL